MSFLTPKLIWGKMKLLPDDETSHGLGIQQKFRLKNGQNSDNLRLRSPIFQKPFQAKSATSIVARATNHIAKQERRF